MQCRRDIIVHQLHSSSLSPGGQRRRRAASLDDTFNDLHHAAEAWTRSRRTAGDAALYAPCGDLEAFARLIVRLAEGEDLRQRLAERAIERADELVWERSEVELLGAYERL